MPSFRKKRIIKTEIGVCDYSLVCSKIETSIIKNSSLLIFPLATHTLIKAYYDKKLQNILNAYDILTPDSQWIKWSLNWLYGIRLKERVYGPDLMLKVLGLANKNGYPIFLYGTNTKTLKLLINKIQKKYPKLNIAGSSPAPYGDIDIKEQKKIVNEINKSTAKIVFIALSSPKQVILAKQIA
ncbi:MAG: WecB/TagA/CpsF family glycosyltransferase, partial [Parcubacteria group bacterium]|nr:WecB/TagA/CpsF family glycosyltransferase [Parcubacteria group bacterium]